MAGYYFFSDASVGVVPCYQQETTKSTEVMLFLSVDQTIVTPPIVAPIFIVFTGTTLRMNGKFSPSFLDLIRSVNSNGKHRKAIIAQQSKIKFDLMFLMINNEQNIISPIVGLSRLLHARVPDIIGFDELYIEINSVS